MYDNPYFQVRVGLCTGMGDCHGLVSHMSHVSHMSQCRQLYLDQRLVAVTQDGDIVVEKFRKVCHFIAFFENTFFFCTIHQSWLNFEYEMTTLKFSFLLFLSYYEFGTSLIKCNASMMNIVEESNSVSNFQDM